MTQITFAADSADITASRYGDRKLKVIADVDYDDVLAEIPITDVVSHFGANKLLNEIGEEECKEYFGLVDEEDET